ncbi:maleylacetoacetate isomerase [Helicocarpus griseus UAMH5409]|uniref:Maleylacetoacetate isomerase n=1 Tax=Helicocarpus griseus UAMH5409 TaxID=1447875 RepID=A0A2B7XVT0_9EURO|nr:maleylacetoacetate isomerase [Helicocarpus griseus UAMH5409]
MSSEQPLPALHLHTYFRSSCAARLRIALNLKNLPYTTSYVNLLKGEQHSAEHKQLNPSGTVPVLVITSKDPNGAETSFSIGQSIAALEYLEEITANTTDNLNLLPPVTDVKTRAQIRTLVQIMASDIQPVTNLRIQKRVSALGADNTAWARELMQDGFRALETVLKDTAGEYCVGDGLSLADVCLVPAVWAALRIGVELREYPVLERVWGRLEELEAVKKAHWKRQGDTPEELRG